ncbi:Avirulence (Avh) protein, partial [Phytophthora megakarya]
MQALRVVYVVTIIVISSIFAEAAITPKSVGVSKTSSDRESQRDTHATTTNGASGKRFLRIEEATNANIMATGSMGDTSNNSSTEVASQEERGVRAVPLEVVGKQESASKFVKGKTITTAVTNLLRRNKERKILRKFRIKLLESLPPEQAATLIFLKRPKKELPAELSKKELPSKLPKKEL